MCFVLDIVVTKEFSSVGLSSVELEEILPHKLFSEQSIDML